MALSRHWQLPGRWSCGARPAARARRQEPWILQGLPAFRWAAGRSGPGSFRVPGRRCPDHASDDHASDHTAASDDLRVCPAWAGRPGPGRASRVRVSTGESQRCTGRRRT